MWLIGYVLLTLNLSCSYSALLPTKQGPDLFRDYFNKARTKQGPKLFDDYFNKESTKQEPERFDDYFNKGITQRNHKETTLYPSTIHVHAGTVRTHPIPIYFNSRTLCTEHFNKLSSKASKIVATQLQLKACREHRLWRYASSNIYHMLDHKHTVVNSELSLLQSKVAGTSKTFSLYTYSVGRLGAWPWTWEKKGQGHTRPATW